MKNLSKSLVTTRVSNPIQAVLFNNVDSKRLLEIER